MTGARRHMITELYAATPGDEGAGRSFESWRTGVLASRGPFERKRAASRADLAKAWPGLPADLDIARFVFAVETYMAVRATMLVHLGATAGATGEEIFALAEREGLTGDFGWALECLRQQPPAILNAEITSGRSLVRQFFEGPFFDVFQEDHRTLIPKQLRHTAGTYYTPQWLARHVLGTVGYRAAIDGFAGKRIIDPACGSGVFLVAAANELREAVGDGTLTLSAALDALAGNLIGADIDPLAVVQTRANLRLAQMALSNGAVAVEPLVAQRDSLLDQPGDVKADLVVGNPPWVNWEYLPPDFRASHAELWPKLSIFGLQGKERAFSKEDISALFFAHAVDAYLGDGGQIAYLVPQSLVKSTLNHRGFRRFTLRSGQLDEVAFGVDLVEDLVEIKPFDGAANRTIMIRATRGQPTSFPVTYRRWLKVDVIARESLDLDLSGVETLAEAAEPADAADPASHWMTGRAAALATARRISGPCAYRARTGVFTGGANGVFHLDVLDAEGELLRVSNITERAKRIVSNVTAELEPEFVYPFLRGRDVTQWRYDCGTFILLPHTAQSRMRPVSEDVLAGRAPRTLSYLSGFKDVLGERAGFAGWERQVLQYGFYACQRVGEYTFAPWKVLWRYIAPTFTTAVVGPYRGAGPFAGRPIIPNEKLMSIACDTPREAYYVGGLLASSPVVTFVQSRMISTQITPSLIERLALPAFREDNPLHLRLADACAQAHEAAARGDRLDAAREEVDAIGAEVLGVSRQDALLLRELIEDR